MRDVGRFLQVVVGISLACATPFVLAADDDARPDAVPYRPTVTTPAALSAPGWLEGEFGGMWLRDRSTDDASPRRASVPYTIKYAFTEDWGVRVGGEALVRTSGDGERTTGFGDTNIVFKRRFAVDDSSAFGLEVGGLFPTGRRPLHAGSGEPDYSANGIYSLDVAGWHSDLNVIGTRFGARDANGGDSHWQTMVALAASHPLIDRWQAAVEWTGTRQRGTASMSQLLGALSWSPRGDIVFDVGGIRGLNHATPPWQVFAGVTVVLGRID